jgi:predicted O-methyltransferase YrrM
MSSWGAVIVLATLGAGAVVGVLIVGRRWKNTLFHDLNAAITRISQELRAVRVEVEETRALVALQEPRFSIPLPWSNWALPPRGLLEVLRTVQEFEAPMIVECGSGVSTLHLARAVRAIGRGHVTALEQDADWAEYIGRMLARSELDHWATIVVAPIENAVICDRNTSWYAIPAGALPKEPVDIVIVDGPRGPEGDLVRLGALPRLWDRLSRRAVVFLDDTNRPDERAISQLWRERFAVNETSAASEHGMSKFTRRDA